MNPKHFSTGALIALIILLAVTTVSGVEVPFIDPIALGSGTPRPYGSLISDIDGDGDNDIIAISNNETVPSRMIKMLESNGATPPAFTLRAVSPGTFAYRSIALHPKGLALADINADGIQDVVSCSVGKVSWHETSAGPGITPTFVHQIVYSDTTSGYGGTDFLSVAATDLNHDGRIDLVAANNTTDEIWVFMNGEDEFDPQEIIWTELTAATGILEPSMIAAADMNMDGHVDVVVADSAGDRLLWLQNDGGATPAFTTHEISATEDGVRSIAIVDLNLDGYPEIFSASTDDSRVVWWANGGTAAPVFTPTDITDSLTGAFSIAVHDLDRDGDLDVVVGITIPASGTGGLVWFDSDGSYPPSYTERTISSGGGAVRSVTVGDIDGDGDGDLLSADTTDNTLYLLENRLCSIGFPARFVTSSHAFGADAVHAADLNGDGVPDIVSASFYSSPINPNPGGARRDITWFANDGNILPTLTEAAVPIEAVGNRAQSVSTGDIDGDGDLDVLAASETGNWIRWYANSGSASPTFTQNTVTPLMFSARDAIAADVDGDGDMDVIGASSSENKVSWFENDGSATPVFTEHVVTRNAIGAWSVYAGDLDGDGDMDIASAALGNGYISWYQNNGGTPPLWTEAVVFAPAEDIIPAAIDIIGADMDQDGDIDLVAASVYLDKIAWYQNSAVPAQGTTPATVQFTERVVTKSVNGQPGFARGASSIFAGDLDGDGDLDLVATAALNNRLAWFESDGLPTPTLFPRSISVDTLGSRSAVTADLNGDGLLDIIIASALDNSISTFLNLVGDSCMAFDASRDGNLNAQELAWIGRSFGLIRDGETPGDDWWAEIDFDGDGRVDGTDLAILGSTGVWGRSVLNCSYTCND